MTGGVTDPLEWQPHIRKKLRLEAIAKRFKNPHDPLRLVIVRDMWLTGFDVPCLHTMYLDKYMHQHGLMQAITRVNRVFREKPGGLVVDYLGLAQELKKALSTYTEGGGQGALTRPQHEAVEVMLRKHQECCALFQGFQWTNWTTASAVAKLSILPGAQEHILSQPEGKEKLSKAVSDLSHAFALAVPHEDAIRIRDDVGFFQAVKSVLAKTPSAQHQGAATQIAIRQNCLQCPHHSGRSGHLRRRRTQKTGNLHPLGRIPGRDPGHAATQSRGRTPAKLLKAEIKTRASRNIVLSRKFSELIEASLRRYQNRAIETAQVIEELLAAARDLREAAGRGASLGLTDDELAFYDALEVNDSAAKILGDPSLRLIARELTEYVRTNVSIDWTQRENVRAKIRVIVKRILKKYGYPQTKQERATQTVLEQAEVLSQAWLEKSPKQ